MSENLNDAGHGIGAVQRALRAANEFQAVRSRQGQHAEVEYSAGIVDRDAVHNYLVVGGLAAAHKQGRQSAALPGRAHHCAGKKMQSVISRHRPHDFQLSRVQDFDVGRSHAAWNQGASGAYVDSFQWLGPVEGQP